MNVELRSSFIIVYSPVGEKHFVVCEQLTPWVPTLILLYSNLLRVSSINALLTAGGRGGLAEDSQLQAQDMKWVSGD